jgi:Flp pilus assembly protein TadG
VNAKQTKKDLRHDARGAVYVEFLIVFLPLFVLFMSLVQFAFVEVANLVTKHAAVTAVRAAIVVLPDDPAYYEKAPINKPTGGRKDAIEAAAKARLMAVAVLPSVEVKFPVAPGATDEKTQYAQDDIVRVRVEFDYKCGIPIGARFVCDLLTQHKKLKAEAAMPMQGAGYEY